MMRRRLSFLGVLAIVLGFALRLYFVRALSRVAGDSLVYGELAANMLRHHAYAFTDGPGLRETLIRLPGYPVFLAATFAVFGIGKYTAVLYVNLAIDLCSCIILAALARNLMGPSSELCAIWLAALCPFTANYVAAPLTETPAVFCVALAFYALERWWFRLNSGSPWNIWLLPLGSSLSVAVLLRRIVYYFSWQ